MKVGPATFWYGSKLSFIEVLCLKSYIDIEIPIVLYTYDEVADVPNGVLVKDAAEIVSKELLFKNLERDSYAPFADYFRYKLLQETDYYWVDADALALSRFPLSNDYLFAEQHNVVINGVLSLPSDSPVLVDLIDACERPSPRMPWLPVASRRRLIGLGDQFDLTHLPFKALGPMALNWIIRRYNLEELAVPTNVLYPFAPRHMLKSGSRMLRSLPQEAVSIHLYNSQLRKRLKEAGKSTAPPGSLVDVLCHKHGVDPLEFPLM